MPRTQGKVPSATFGPAAGRGIVCHDFLNFGIPSSSTRSSALTCPRVNSTRIKLFLLIFYRILAPAPEKHGSVPKIYKLYEFRCPKPPGVILSGRVQVAYSKLGVGLRYVAKPKVPAPGGALEWPPPNKKQCFLSFYELFR